MKKILISFIMMFLIYPVFAQDADKTQGVISKMQENDAQVNTLEADFIQELLFTSTNEKQKISGNVKYLKPDNAVIVQKTPQEQRIYINGRKIIIYTPENFQALEDNYENVINANFSPAAIVNFGANYKNISKNNIVKYLSEDESSYVLEVYPKTNKDWSMKLFVSKENLRPSKAVVLSEGAQVTVEIKNYKINPELNKNLFKFKAPASVEVIKLN
ncbi:LolA family protein [Endomicrobium proavitum]|uniref:Outer-membrane lipoprotein carrier protein n=1 Tax=Endomicrobium proavitum TaxID=1408281 RepID=A0A0G3WH59_9BACT|nr:outer membrane lipoprotein carrier protein LolA [Endomicrobium proavitum]AKL97956.1 Outer-membrane lipoprotein carrier protein [Endomicrobium proavitum]